MKKTTVAILLFMIVLSLSAQDKKQSPTIPEGYGTATWASQLSAVRPAIKGKLVFTDEKSVIVSRDGELKYTYGFFYVDPEKHIQGTTGQSSTAPADEHKDEGKLFFVILSFPYLTMQDVKKKYEETYGAPTIENIEKNQGAIAWDDDKSIIVIWVDDYEGKAYSRRVSYVSKTVAREVNDYTYTMFNRTELEVIKTLMP
jgi:hypothetical protein